MRATQDYFRSFASVLALGASLCLGGCIGRDAVLHDVAASRAEAYRQWATEKESKEKSQALVSGKLSLADAIKLSLHYNKPLLSMLEEKEKSKGRIMESYGSALPSATLDGAYTRRSSLGTPASGFLDNYSSELTVTQPLFTGGAASAAIRAARLYSLYADEQVRGQVQQTIYDTSKAYYDILIAGELYNVKLEAVKTAEAHLAEVEKRLAAGNASDYDVLRAQVEVSNFKAEMIEQRNRLSLAKLSLYKTMGVSQQSEVEAQDKLEYESMLPVLEQAVRIALENRSDLYRAELSVRMQEQAVRLAKSSYWPKLAGFFSYDAANPHPRVNTYDKDEWGDKWNAGLSASWSVFDGLAREGKLKQEKAELEKQKLNLIDAQEAVLLEIQQALLSIHDAEELVDSQKMNVKHATEGLRRAQEGFRAGVFTGVERLDAQTALTTAWGNYYTAIYTHTLAKLQLQKAMGILGPEPGDAEVPAECPVPPARIEEFSGKK